MKGDTSLCTLSEVTNGPAHLLIGIRRNHDMVSGIALRAGSINCSFPKYRLQSQGKPMNFGISLLLAGKAEHHGATSLRPETGYKS